MFWLGVRSPNLPFPWGSGRDPHLTQYVIGPHQCTCQMASKSVQRFKQEYECDGQTDRPRYGEMCSNRRNCLRCKTRFRFKIGQPYSCILHVYIMSVQFRIRSQRSPSKRITVGPTVYPCYSGASRFTNIYRLCRKSNRNLQTK